jgi:hypothetical protein
VKRLSQPDAVAALSWWDEQVEADLDAVHPLRRTARRLVRPLRRAGKRSPYGLAGYDATGWDATVWVVHAMYETDEIPGDLTHDEAWRIERAAGASEPEFGIPKLDEFLAETTLTGARLGGSAWPGPGWRRLFWHELAARLDVDPYGLDVPPCDRSFPYTSWPLSITPPAEGSLDREQFLFLLDHLAEASRDGNQTVCTAYRAPLASWDWPEEDHTVFECELRELIGLYESEGHGAPSNIWPDDRAWFTYTDWDLWATKVSGSQDLIARILEDDELEGVILDF